MISTAQQIADRLADARELAVLDVRELRQEVADALTPTTARGRNTFWSATPRETA